MSSYCLVLVMPCRWDASVDPSGSQPGARGADCGQLTWSCRQAAKLGYSRRGVAGIRATELRTQSTSDVLKIVFAFLTLQGGHSLGNLHINYFVRHLSKQSLT